MTEVSAILQVRATRYYHFDKHTVGSVNSDFENGSRKNGPNMRLQATDRANTQYRRISPAIPHSFTATAPYHIQSSGPSHQPVSDRAAVFAPHRSPNAQPKQPFETFCKRTNPPTRPVQMNLVPSPLQVKSYTGAQLSAASGSEQTVLEHPRISDSTRTLALESSSMASLSRQDPRLARTSNIATSEHNSYTTTKNGPLTSLELNNLPSAGGVSNRAEINTGTSPSPNSQGVTQFAGPQRVEKTQPVFMALHKRNSVPLLPAANDMRPGTHVVRQTSDPVGGHRYYERIQYTTESRSVADCTTRLQVSSVPSSGLPPALRIQRTSVQGSSSATQSTPMSNQTRQNSPRDTLMHDGNGTIPASLRVGVDQRNAAVMNCGNTLSSPGGSGRQLTPASVSGLLPGSVPNTIRPHSLPVNHKPSLSHPELPRRVSSQFALPLSGHHGSSDGPAGNESQSVPRSKDDKAADGLMPTHGQPGVILPGPHATRQVSIIPRKAVSRGFGSPQPHSYHHNSPLAHSAGVVSPAVKQHVNSQTGSYVDTVHQRSWEYQSHYVSRSDSGFGEHMHRGMESGHYWEHKKDAGKYNSSYEHEARDQTIKDGRRQESAYSGDRHVDHGSNEVVYRRSSPTYHQQRVQLQVQPPVDSEYGKGAQHTTDRQYPGFDCYNADEQDDHFHDDRSLISDIIVLSRAEVDRFDALDEIASYDNVTCTEYDEFGGNPYSDGDTDDRDPPGDHGAISEHEKGSDHSAGFVGIEDVGDEWKDEDDCSVYSEEECFSDAEGGTNYDY